MVQHDFGLVLSTKLHVDQFCTPVLGYVAAYQLRVHGFIASDCHETRTSDAGCSSHSCLYGVARFPTR
jgi:hypothetical protein